ncbi:MAG: phosphotransferase, partial [Rhodobacterales bacterium]|nr:phosphotransferase [Rhodobacterales bacterium]
LSLIATDDAHFSEPDHFGGWVMVKAQENTPEALLAALKSGALYSSQGPELRDVRLEGDHVVIESSAVVSAVAIGHGTGAKAVHGHSMTRAEVPLVRLNNSPWIRVAVIDAAGKRAWSNPIWREGGKNPRTL